MVVTAKPFAMMMIVGSDFDELILVADDPELDAQVPAEVPPGESQRHPSAPLLHIQDLRLQGNPTHLYPEAHIFEIIHHQHNIS